MTASARTDALTPEMQAEFERAATNPCVGTQLLSESDRARVWYIRLRPGERLGFHRHVLDYFWTALSEGEAVSHVEGGPPTRGRYKPGQTSHLTFGPGESMTHDLENVGSTDLIFMTVEHLRSANQPLPLPPGTKPAGLNGSLAQP